MGYGKGGGQSQIQGEHSQTNTQQQSSYSKDATFNPYANETLKGLSSLFGEASTGLGSDISNLYSSMMQPGGQNPYVESVIGTTDKLGQTDFSNKLAQVRSGGYGGGTGRDTINQGQFASTYQAQRDQANAQLRYDAYNQQRGSQLAAAQGAQNTLNQALQYLQLMRGETGISASETLELLKRISEGHGIWGEGGGGGAAAGGATG